MKSAQTSESGFESFLPVSETSPASGAATPPPGWTAVCCPRAGIVKETKASSSAGATTGCRPTFALRIIVMGSFVLMSVTSPAFVIALSLPYPAPSRPFLCLSIRAFHRAVIRSGVAALYSLVLPSCRVAKRCTLRAV